MTVLIDTNVLRVANDTAAERYGPACVLAATDLLEGIRDTGTLALDANGAIVAEYLNNANAAGMPGVGDAFLQWVLTYQASPPWCEPVAITPHPDRGWKEFPDAADVADFDPSDRKFVAVALTHPDRPHVHNATDSDWLHHRDALAGHGVTVVFVCPEEMPTAP